MAPIDALRNDTEQTMDDGLVLHRYEWTNAKPKAQLLIVHGIAEHALRYEHVAQYFVHNDYRVVAYDQRGHGATGIRQHGGDMAKLGRLGRGGQRRVVDDIAAILHTMRAERPDLPIGILAHSWGSLSVQSLINRNAEVADAVVLTGTAWRRLGHMNSGDLNKRHAHLGTTGGEWLTRDEEMVEAWADDPLTFEARTMQLLGPLESAKLLGRPAKRLQHDLPLLVVSGADDSIGSPSSLERLVADYRRRSGFGDVTLEVLPGARHEVLNETNRDEVLRLIEEWLTLRLTLAARNRSAA